MIRHCARVVVFAALLSSKAAFAVAWDDLSESQQQVLSKYQSQWSGLSSEQQQRLATGAQRWSTMASIVAVVTR